MIKEKITIGAGTDYPMNGILTLPDDLSAPMPAAVLVHGSGPSDMDEKIGGLTPFKDIAEGLAAHGIATIRYDKRTFAHGRKLLKLKDVTVWSETIEDALLATEILKSDSRIDKEKVFIIGHSMGALLAPRIDAEGGNYRGLILMAGSPRKLEEILIDQNNVIMESSSGLIKFIISKQINKLSASFENLYDITDEEAKQTKMGGGITLYYFKEMGEHPASMYLNNLDKPVLIMQGEKDFQATVEKDFNAYKELLKDKTNVTFKLYETLNHAFVQSIYGDITKANKEYQKERHITEEVICDIANFIK